MSTVRAESHAAPWNRPGLAAAVVFACLPLLALLLTGRAPYFNDVRDQSVPDRAFIKHELSLGRLPLLADQVLAGFPFHENPISAWLYPPRLLTLPFGHLSGQLVEFLIQAAFCGAFGYLFLRRLGCPVSAALLGSVAYSLSGPGVYWVRHPAFHATFCWLPAMLWSLDRVLAGPLPARAVALAVSAALAFLGGGHQVFLYQCVILSVFAVLRRPRPASYAKAGLCLLLSLPLFVCLVAAQLVPSLRLVGESLRSGGVSEAVAREYAIAFVETVNLLVPDAIGPAASGTVGFAYVGLVPWLLLPFALGRRPLRWLGALLLLGVAVGLSVGPASPVWRGVRAVAPLAVCYFRQPARFLYLIAAAVPFVAACGAPGYTLWMRSRAGVVVHLTGGVLGLAVVLVLSRHGLPATLLGKRLLVLGTLLAVLSVVALVRSPRLRTGLLAGVLLLDLSVFAVPYLQRVDRAAPLGLDPLHPWVREASARVGPSGRLFLANRLHAWHQQPLMTPAASLSGYQHLYPRWLGELFWTAVRPDIRLGGPLAEDLSKVTAPDLPQRLVDLFQVRSIVGAKDSSEPRGIRETEPRIPWAAVHREWRVAPGDSLRAVLEPSLDLTRRVVLAESPGPPADGSAGGPAAPVERAHPTPTLIRFDVRGSPSGVLRTSDLFLPGWEVRVDGEPREVVRVNHAFLGAIVKSGDSVVEFRYRSPGLGALLLCWVGGWLVVLVSGVSAILRCRRRGRAGREDGPASPRASHDAGPEASR